MKGHGLLTTTLIRPTNRLSRNDDTPHDVFRLCATHTTNSYHLEGALPFRTLWSTLWVIGVDTPSSW